MLRLALDILPPQTGVLVDVATATLTSRKGLAGLQQLADAGVTVTVR